MARTGIRRGRRGAVEHPCRRVRRGRARGRPRTARVALSHRLQAPAPDAVTGRVGRDVPKTPGVRAGTGAMRSVLRVTRTLARAPAAPEPDPPVPVGLVVQGLVPVAPVTGARVLDVPVLSARTPVGGRGRVRRPPVSGGRKVGQRFGRRVGRRVGRPRPGRLRSGPRARTVVLVHRHSVPGGRGTSGRCRHVPGVRGRTAPARPGAVSSDRRSHVSSDRRSQVSSDRRSHVRGDPVPRVARALLRHSARVPVRGLTGASPVARLRTVARRGPVASAPGARAPTVNRRR